MKRRWFAFWCVLLLSISLVMGGCKEEQSDKQLTAKATAEEAAKEEEAETKEKDAESAEKQEEQKEAEKKEADSEEEESEEEEAEEEEYYDITNVEGEDKDYSKYEDVETEASGGETAGGEDLQNSYAEYSNGTQTGQDEYGTDPVPEGQQNPVEPENVQIDNSRVNTCYLNIYCGSVLNNMDNLAAGKESVVPSDGVIYAQSEVTFYEGESVFDVLLREVQNNRIHMEYEFTPGFNSNYIEGIGNLYEFDCGQGSGWMFCVNGWYPNYGCSRYVVQPGDVIEWNYTCDYGSDLGADWTGQHG